MFVAKSPCSPNTTSKLQQHQHVGEGLPHDKHTRQQQSQRTFRLDSRTQPVPDARFLVAAQDEGKDEGKDEVSGHTTTQLD